MKHLSPSIKLFVQMAATYARVSSKLDRSLGGLHFSEFLVLLHLEQAPDRQRSRIDLAEKVGLTASGITRVLLPMEKIHLVRNGDRTDDARVRRVEITRAGREKLHDELVRLQYAVDEMLPADQKYIDEITRGLASIADSIT